MAHESLLSKLSLLVLTLAIFSDGVTAVNYAVQVPAASTPGGARFLNEVGAAYARQTMISATNFILSVFRQSNVNDQKFVPRVVLIVEDIDGVAYATSNEIHLSARYVRGFNGDVKREITGVLYHEMVHIHQWSGGAPVGLLEGIADFVRLRAGLAPPGSAQPGDGTRWDEGYGVTARFLDYCEGLRNGFVAELNKKMRTGYSNNFFLQLLGKSVDQLWREYKRRYGREL